MTGSGFEQVMVEKKALINEFVELYGVDYNIVTSYLDSVQMGDRMDSDVCFLILEESCPSMLVGDMKKDLQKLVKDYFEN